MTYVLGFLILRNGNTRLTPEAGQLNRNNLGIELTTLLSSLSLLVRTNGIFILLLTVEAVVLGTLLSRKTHEFLLVCIGKTVLHDTVDQVLVAVFGTVTESGKVVRCVGHGLHATGDDDIGTASLDVLDSEHDGLQAGGTNFVHGCAYCAILETGTEGGLSGGVLSNTIKSCQFL